MRQIHELWSKGHFEFPSLDEDVESPLSDMTHACSSSVCMLLCGVRVLSQYLPKIQIIHASL